MSEKLQILQDFYDRVWVEGKVETAESFFDPEAEASGLMSDMAVGGEEFHEFVGALLEQIKVNKVTMLKSVEQGDWISIAASFEGIVMMTGQPVEGHGMLLACIRDGKIKEAYNFFDFLGFFEKLGLMPENTLALCLTGQRLS